MRKLRFQLISAAIIILVLLSFPSFIFAQSSGVEAFVTRFYNLCLDRQPDSAGLDNWVGHLKNGSLTGADVAQRFIFSQEFLAKQTTDEQFLDIMYKAFFGRDPDPEGYAGWLGQLQNGKSRSFVLTGFVNSVEFSQLCSAYGIEPGSVVGSSSAEEASGVSITGSEDFKGTIIQATDLLKSGHARAYRQLSLVVEIKERDLSNFQASAVADVGRRVISIDLSSFSGFGEDERIKIIAATLSHELNHIANRGIADSLSVADYEYLALTQELETCYAIGAPGWYISYIKATIANIYDSSTWWWNNNDVAA